MGTRLDADVGNRNGDGHFLRPHRSSLIEAASCLRPIPSRWPARVTDGREAGREPIHLHSTSEGQRAGNHGLAGTPGGICSAVSTSSMTSPLYAIEHATPEVSGTNWAHQACSLLLVRLCQEIPLAFLTHCQADVTERQ
jgi:hypothetical protein